MFKVTIILLFFALFHFSTNSNEIEVRITSDKTNYLEGEMIVMGVYFKNTTNRELSINSDCGNLPYTNFKFSGDSNDIRYIGAISDCIGKSYLKFDPNEEKSYRIFLLNNYTSNYKSRMRLEYSPASVKGLIERGEYNVTFINNNLISNSLNITVTKPSDEDSIALANLIDIYSMVTRGYYVDKISKYRKFIYEFPNNEYIHQAFMNMMVLKFPHLTDEYTVIDSKWFISMHPNSPVIDYAINTVEKYYNEINNLNEYKSFLNDIVINYTNSTASNLAQKKIKEYNN
jgi:hypothetical protein